jgi:hypothetical protein
LPKTNVEDDYVAHPGDLFICFRKFDGPSEGNHQHPEEAEDIQGTRQTLAKPKKRPAGRVSANGPPSGGTSAIGTAGLVVAAQANPPLEE